MLPPIAATAFCLDLDGTLLDIAPKPELVAVPPGLIETLLRLRSRCGEALAIVSGRPVPQIEALLPGVAYAIAGEHGAAIRHSPGAEIAFGDVPPMPRDWMSQAEAAVARFPGTLVELKSASLVLHYRLAARARETLRAAAEALAARVPGFAVMEASMAWEIKPACINKGAALRAVMAQAPFAGRKPVFIGDDITDRDGIAAAAALGGVGLWVPGHFGDAAGVRRWLAACCVAGGVNWPGV
jgi:trehalose 6-phosphate phosphatase